MQPRRIIFSRDNVGHIILLAFIASITIWYLNDTFQASRRIENLMIVLPAGIILLSISFWQIFLIIYMGKPLEKNQESISYTETSNAKRMSLILTAIRIPIYMTLIGLYIIGLIYFVFDASTFLFIFCSLLILGTKKWIYAFCYSILFSWFVTWALKNMVSFPIPTILV